MHQVYQNWKLLFELLFAVGHRTGMLYGIPLMFYAVYLLERHRRVPAHKQVRAVASAGKAEQRKAA